jgi:hypothetical protein
MSAPIEDLYETSFTLRLLCAKNARLVLGFLYAAFKENNRHLIEETDLEFLLEKHLSEHTAGQLEDSEANNPNAIGNASDSRARNYLKIWCGNDCRYLRRTFDEERGCYIYQLTHHGEKALQWLGELSTNASLGHTTTESRFSRIFDELQNLARQTNENPRAREKELLAQRDKLDDEIQTIRATGRVSTLDDIQVKDRLIDLNQMIEAFVSDFRAIEDRFKEQSAEIQSIHLEEQRSKGDIVAHVLDSDEHLRNSEQGRSYFGFREVFRSIESRERFSEALKTAATLAAKTGLDGRVYASLIERLTEQTAIVHNSFGKIAAQLRRIVEESSVQNARQLLDWIAEIKQSARALRETPPQPDSPDGTFVRITENIAWNNLMELGFYERKNAVNFAAISAGDDNADIEDVRAALRKIGKPLDLASYRDRVARLLEKHAQISLGQVVSRHPIQNGAVDLVAYLCVAAENERHLIDENETEDIDLNRPHRPRFVTLNRIIYQRPQTPTAHPWTPLLLPVKK